MPHHLLLSLHTLIPSLTPSRITRPGSQKMLRGKFEMGVIGEYSCHTISPRILKAITIRSCFNAFSRVDIRLDVKIPGGVDAYFVDLRGER